MRSTSLYLPTAAGFDQRRCAGSAGIIEIKQIAELSLSTIVEKITVRLALIDLQRQTNSSVSSSAVG